MLLKKHSSIDLQKEGKSECPPKRRRVTLWNRHFSKAASMHQRRPLTRRLTSAWQAQLR